MRRQAAVTLSAPLSTVIMETTVIPLLTSVSFGVRKCAWVRAVKASDLYRRANGGLMA